MEGKQCVHLSGTIVPIPPGGPEDDEGMWEVVRLLCECCTCERMCFYRLGEIARDNGCLVTLSRVSSIAHIVALWQVWGSVRGDTNGVQEVCFL